MGLRLNIPTVCDGPRLCVLGGSARNALVSHVGIDTEARDVFRRVNHFGYGHPSGLSDIGNIKFLKVVRALVLCLNDFFARITLALC